MHALPSDPRISAIWALLFALLITLAACGTLPETSPAPEVAMPLATLVRTSDQATLAAAALIQEDLDSGNRAVATAEIVRAHAQSTLNAANATVSAAQTQDQNNANVFAAQLAATAEFERANAEATLNSAASTQGAALTQDAIRQTQLADFATTDAEALVNQQNKDELAAFTQTAVANIIATQTQSAVATSQWYADQSRIRQEQRQGPIAFLWMWCLPVFIVIFGVLCLWGFWRWLSTDQNRRRFAVRAIDRRRGPPGAGQAQDKFLQPGSDVVDGRNRLTQPDDQMRGWLDEVKRKLMDQERDDDDNPDV